MNRRSSRALATGSALAVAGGIGFFLAFTAPPQADPPEQPIADAVMSSAPPPPRWTPAVAGPPVVPTTPLPVPPPPAAPAPPRPAPPAASPVGPRYPPSHHAAATPAPRRQAVSPVARPPLPSRVPRAELTPRQELERRARIVEETANRELQRLIPRLRLDAAQQDRVFAIATATSPYFSDEMLPEIRSDAATGPAPSKPARKPPSPPASHPAGEPTNRADTAAKAPTPSAGAPAELTVAKVPLEDALPALPPKEELIFQELTLEQQEEYALYVGEVDSWWESFAEAESYRLDAGIPTIAAASPAPEEEEGVASAAEAPVAGDTKTIVTRGRSPASP